MSATKPPWIVRSDFKCADGSTQTGVCAQSIDSGRAAVAWVCGVDESQIRSNANQIAAAPELLAACEYMLEKAFERKWDGDEHGYTLITRAIRKAKRGTT